VSFRVELKETDKEDSTVAGFGKRFVVDLSRRVARCIAGRVFQLLIEIGIACHVYSWKKDERHFARARREYNGNVGREDTGAAEEREREREREREGGEGKRRAGSVRAFSRGFI